MNDTPWSPVFIGGHPAMEYSGYVLLRLGERCGSPAVVYPYYVVRRKEEPYVRLGKRERRFRGWFDEVEREAARYVDRLIAKERKGNGQDLPDA